MATLLHLDLKPGDRAVVSDETPLSLAKCPKCLATKDDLGYIGQGGAHPHAVNVIHAYQCKLCGCGFTVSVANPGFRPPPSPSDGRDDYLNDPRR